MLFVVKDKQEGKTTFLVGHMLVNKNNILVVHNGEERDRLVREYPVLKDRVNHPKRIFTFEQVRRGSHRGYTGNVLVDNVDLLLNHIIGPGVKLVTATGETYGSSEEDFPRYGGDTGVIPF
jgi:hypothetical protein